MMAFQALLRRDLVLSYRQGVDAWVVVLFFLAAGILFPFAIAFAMHETQSARAPAPAMAS